MKKQHIQRDNIQAASHRGINQGTANKTNVSRRDFLWRATMLGAGLAAQAPISAMANGMDTARDAQDTHFITQRARGKNKSSATQTMPHVEAHVHLNQVGFLPNEGKRAVIPASAPIPGNAFSIIDDAAMPKVRYQAELTPYSGPSDPAYGRCAHYSIADFDDFTRPGRYRLRLSNGTISAPFSIHKDLYGKLIPLTLDYFAMQRCGMACAQWHDDCHPDDGTIVGGPRDGQRLDASGGWHDAGDYMKFVETTSYATALMLFAADNFPALAQKPRHLAPSDTPPLLLAHARVGLEWLLKMHPAPNEFYYQVGEESDHDTWRLPEHDNATKNAAWKPRPVYFGIGANLAGRCAAAFAMASRLYLPYDAAFAARCRQSAQTVYRLGLDNPAALSTLPADFYPEKTWQDDMAWGAVELYRATHKQEYLTQSLAFAHQVGAAHEATSVYDTHAFAHYTLHPLVGGADRERLRQYLRDDADNARLRAENPYGLATPYIWGTAEAATGAALNCLLYARLLERDDRRIYTQIARQQRDFILGCNPFNLSYLIGAGSHYPLFPHHQVANINKTELTGALVGGPSSSAIFKGQRIDLNNAGDMQMTPGPILPPDLPDDMAVYHDAVQDYVTNEPAIDYTAKFLLLAAFYDHPASV